MKNIVADLILDIIKEFEKAALAKAALGLAGKGIDLAGQGGIGGAIFGAISGGAGAAGSTANTAALTANTTAVTAQTTAATADATALTAQTTAMSASWAEQLASFASLITTMAANTAAIIANTTALAVRNVEGAIPGFDVGSWSVPSTMPAVVHQGEMILPADAAASVRQGTASLGGNSVTFAPNFSGFIGTQAMINQIMPQLARALQNYQFHNPSLAGG